MSEEANRKSNAGYTIARF